MNKLRNDALRYLTISADDEEWGNTITTVGCQSILPGVPYPPNRHPEEYRFQPHAGRILNEYQIIYIINGSGFFKSQSCRLKPIKAGTLLLLFPGEWHSYYPNPSTGWEEYWVGFRGRHVDELISKQFFTPEEPIYRIGLSSTIIGLYEDLLRFAIEEKSGHQPLISSIVTHILGSIYYKRKNNSISNTFVINKINEARIMMKANVEESIKPEEIAAKLGLGYSWFRRMFKEQTGISPAQYQIQLKITLAKKLLTESNISISEIAHRLHLESSGQFSTFFKRKEGITPTAFRTQFTQSKPKDKT